jgi:hypothetical protein
MLLLFEIDDAIAFRHLRARRRLAALLALPVGVLPASRGDRRPKAEAAGAQTLAQ